MKTLHSLVCIVLSSFFATSFGSSYHDFRDVRGGCYRPKTPCSAIPNCLNCSMRPPTSCAFHGPPVEANCTVPSHVMCEGTSQTYKFTFRCRYCWQLSPSEIECQPVTKCSSIAPPLDRLVTTTCRAKPDVLCYGNQKFLKRIPCNWTNGYKWSTALILSITLGGFGADRFYLGLWREGIGKIFSFGGLGVWTLVDVILIATGYVGPADGSLYM